MKLYRNRYSNSYLSYLDAMFVFGVYFQAQHLYGKDSP